MTRILPTFCFPDWIYRLLNYVFVLLQAMIWVAADLHVNGLIGKYQVPLIVGKISVRL